MGVSLKKKKKKVVMNTKQVNSNFCIKHVFFVIKHLLLLENNL